MTARNDRRHRVAPGGRKNKANRSQFRAHTGAPWALMNAYRQENEAEGLTESPGFRLMGNLIENQGD